MFYPDSTLDDFQDKFVEYYPDVAIFPNFKNFIIKIYNKVQLHPDTPIALFCKSIIADNPKITREQFATKIKNKFDIGESDIPTALKYNLMYDMAIEYLNGELVERANLHVC